MSEEHVHEWEIDFVSVDGQMLFVAACAVDDCPQPYFDQREINCRLNATERLEEINKGLFNIIKTYHPAYLDGCECPQCGDMPIYFDDVDYADTLEGK